jgi:hypothetical protein
MPCAFSASASRGCERDFGKDIRRRYRHSRLNLIHLLPILASLRLYDTSADADPAAGRVPTPMLVLEMQRGAIVNPGELTDVPERAKPIVAAAIKLRRA